jgi:hypothetical protein
VADYVTHRPSELPRFARWICRTADQDAIGFEPGTCGVEGYTIEKAAGRYTPLAPGATFHAEIGVGALSQAEASRMTERIARLIGQESAS